MIDAWRILCGSVLSSVLGLAPNGESNRRAVMMNLLDHFALRDGVDPMRVAAMCQAAENRVVGAPCGIMDQVTSCIGNAAARTHGRCGRVSVRSRKRFVGKPGIGNESPSARRAHHVATPQGVDPKNGIPEQFFITFAHVRYNPRRPLG